MNKQHTAVGTDYARRLMLFGIALFNFGLLTGFLLPLMENARVGLSSHLEGLFNGLVLIVLGLVWSRLNLGAKSRKIIYYLAVYGTYANWLATLLAGFIGAGGSMMPIAAGDFVGTALQEGLIAFALLSLSVAMIVVGVMVFWGMKDSAASKQAVLQS